MLGCSSLPVGQGFLLSAPATRPNVNVCTSITEYAETADDKEHVSALKRGVESLVRFMLCGRMLRGDQMCVIRRSPACTFPDRSLTPSTARQVATRMTGSDTQLSLVLADSPG